MAQWLRYCATNRNIAGSILDGVIGIFHSGNSIALGSTQPLGVDSASNRNEHQGLFPGG